MVLIGWLIVGFSGGMLLGFRLASSGSAPGWLADTAFVMSQIGLALILWHVFLLFSRARVLLKKGGKRKNSIKTKA